MFKPFFCYSCSEQNPHRDAKLHQLFIICQSHNGRWLSKNTVLVFPLTSQLLYLDITPGDAVDEDTGCLAKCSTDQLSVHITSVSERYGAVRFLCFKIFWQNSGHSMNELSQ